MATTAITDYYQVLGITRGATLKDINSAYKKLALRHHPDKTGGEDGSNDEFQKIQQAVETLRDPVSRAKHDELLNLVHPRFLDEDDFEFPRDYTGWRPHVYMGRSMQGRYMYSYGNSVHMDPNSSDSFEERARWERLRKMFGEEIRERSAGATTAQGSKSGWEERMGVMEETMRRDQGDYQGEEYNPAAGPEEGEGEDHDAFFHRKEYEEAVDLEGAQQQWRPQPDEDGSENGGQHCDYEQQDPGESAEVGRCWYAHQEDTRHQDQEYDTEASEEVKKAAFWEQQDRYERVDAEKCRQRWYAQSSEDEELQSQVNPAVLSDYEDDSVWGQQTLYESDAEEYLEQEYAESVENGVIEEYGEHEAVQPAAETFQGRDYQSTEYETANQSEVSLMDFDSAVAEEPAMATVNTAPADEVNLLEDDDPTTTATTNSATSFFEAKTAQTINSPVPIPNPRASNLNSNSSLGSKIAPLAPYFVSKLTDPNQRYRPEDLSTELKGIVLETYCGWLENLRLSFRDTAPRSQNTFAASESKNKTEAEAPSKNTKDCAHLGYWTKEFGCPECEECGRWKPVFVLVCPGCGIRRCVGCKFSGWGIGDGDGDAVHGDEVVG